MQPRNDVKPFMTVFEYNTCVDEFADGIFRFVAKNLRNEDAARDVVQETFEKLWKRVGEVRFDTAKSYLFKTAYTTMIDSIRRDKNTESIEEAEGYSTDNQYNDVKAVLNKALAQLPDIQRTVILLRDYEGYNYDEIGTITGLNESQVKVYIYRARVFLKSYLVDLDRVI